MVVLFIAYQELSDPLMLSQGLPYIEGLINKQNTFILLTYEKNTNKITPPLKSLGITWYIHRYHSKPRLFATIYDILVGILSTLRILRIHPVKLIHARGFIPAIIGCLPARLNRTPLFFDTRGFLADKYVGGGLLKRRSVAYKIMKVAEYFFLKWVPALSVETRCHKEILASKYPRYKEKIAVIPCCVDTERFNFIKKGDRDILKRYGISEGVVFSYLGKLSTWYLIKEMLDFYEIARTFFKKSFFIFLTQDAPEFLHIPNFFKNEIVTIRPNYEDIPRLLASSDVGIFFINPYRRYNSCPVKYGEYLASGLPVVINSGIGDCDKIVRARRLGVVVEEFTPTNYTKAASELRQLLQEGLTLRKRCRQAATELLSLRDGIEKYSKIYKQLMDAKG